jgi:hypothetical protein
VYLSEPGSSEGLDVEDLLETVVLPERVSEMPSPRNLDWATGNITLTMSKKICTIDQTGNKKGSSCSLVSRESTLFLSA